MTNKTRRVSEDAFLIGTASKKNHLNELLTAKTLRVSPIAGYSQELGLDIQDPKGFRS